MKGNSLFKKIGAIATTAAMLASLGVTGFAANSPSSSNANTGVRVGTPTVTPVDGKAGLYEVSVDYTVTATHEIGVTMLAYASTLGTSLGEDAVTSGYVHSETNPKMKIVGVDQKNASEDTDDTFTAGETGTFTFYVSTTAETYGSQIQMKPGQKGIVLLSGDGANGANGAFFSIPAPAGVVSSVGSITTKIDYPSYVSDDEKLESIKAGALAALGTTGVVVTVGEKEVDPDTVDTIAVTADFAGTHDTEVKKTTEGGYKLVITLKSDVTTANSKYKLTTDTDIEIPLTNVTATALLAETVSVKGNVEGFKLELSAAERGEKELAVAIADKIEATGLIFTGNDGSVEVNTTTDEDLAVTVDESNTFNGYGEYTVTFTVGAGTYTGKNGEVSFNSAIGGSVKVNYKEEDTRWTLSSAVAKNGDTDVTTAEVTLGDNEEKTTVTAVVNAVKDSITNIAVTGTDTNNDPKNEVWDKSTASDWKVYASTDTEKTNELSGDLEAGTYIVEATVANTVVANGSTTISITVTVKEAGPQWACGDVNHDGNVTAFDAAAIARFKAGIAGYEYVETNKTEADVNNDNNITAFDAAVIARHKAGIAGYETLPYTP